jgi:hypothetical protein
MIFITISKFISFINGLSSLHNLQIHFIHQWSLVTSQSLVDDEEITSPAPHPHTHPKRKKKGRPFHSMIELPIGCMEINSCTEILLLKLGAAIFGLD